MLTKKMKAKKNLNKKLIIKKIDKKKLKLKKKQKKIETPKKRRYSSGKAFTISKYNFDSDFVWIKKSYKSSTRPNNVVDKAKEESNFDTIYKKNKKSKSKKKETEKKYPKINMNHTMNKISHKKSNFKR